MSQPSADLIRGVPLFSDLDDKTVERLSAEFVERHFDEGAAIATEGVEGLNFFIVSSGEASVTVKGKRARDAGARQLVRRGRARRQVGPLGDGDGHDTDGGVRAPDLELPPLRRGATGARLEAPRGPRRDAPRPHALDDSGRTPGGRAEADRHRAPARAPGSVTQPTGSVGPSTSLHAETLGAFLDELEAPARRRAAARRRRSRPRWPQRSSRWSLGDPPAGSTGRASPPRPGPCVRGC